MTCQRIKDGFMCGGRVVEYKGWLIEFPSIGIPAMLKPGTLEVVDYNRTPKAFFDAVRECQAIVDLEITPLQQQ